MKTAVKNLLETLFPIIKQQPKLIPIPVRNNQSEYQQRIRK